MLDLTLDTSNGINSSLLEFNNTSVSLESVFKELSNIMGESEYELFLETCCEDDEEIEENPFINTGFEETREGYANTSYSGIYKTAAVGLTRKGISGLKKGTKAAINGVGFAAKAGSISLVKAAKVFMEKVATVMNTVSTMLSKMVATGYPLMGKLQAQTQQLIEMAKNAESREEESFTLKKANKYLCYGDKIADPSTIIEQLKYLNEVQQILLSKDKLEKFKSLSIDTFAPFRSTIQKGKVDYLVLTFAVLGLLVNPGVPAGIILKKIFSAANPGVGEVLDKTARVVGGLYGGVGALALSMGTTSTSVLKQMSVGKLDISAIPKFYPIYSFCNDRDDDEGGLFETRTSKLMLGNHQWVVRDYADAITPNTKGRIGNVGAKFNSIKKEIEGNEVKTLSPDEVVEICKLVNTILENAKQYCKQWSSYAKVYNHAYNNIGDVVLAQEVVDGDGKKQPVAHYTRYAYRNAMNVMLGSVWNNCFGSDNQFIRYLVGICRTLILYCKDSIHVSGSESAVSVDS